jgi:hypothetical protein
MSWLTDYSAAAALSDRLVEHPKHTLLLAAGLMGEAGSVVAEIKKKERETTAYPVCSPSGQVGQNGAIEEERVFGSS